MTNAEIADRLRSRAQLLSAARENAFKVKAFSRAARNLELLAESVELRVRAGADLTALEGIGKSIASAIAEIVREGHLGEGVSGSREKKPVLHWEARPMVAVLEEFLLSKCGVARAEVTGDFRRGVETVDEISFVIEKADFVRVIETLRGFGGGISAVRESADEAAFELPAGILLRLIGSDRKRWGLAMVAATGSAGHLAKIGLPEIAQSRGAFADEAAIYRKAGLNWVPPELRDGRDEADLAARHALPELITRSDIQGDLHAHSTSSDGAHTIERMAGAGAALGYQYLGITDHSKSLRIARGVSEEDLWKQIRLIDQLNSQDLGIRILKSAEVDILADGALDYPDELLNELDYTVCSIHSKFSLDKARQTERILRAMDNRYFTILGHATGRRLLKRPGYEIDFERIARHARQQGCFFEINANPQRLDLSAEHARIAKDAGVKIAISTDAHGTGEFEYMEAGIQQARRAGLARGDVLNTRAWPELRALFRR